MFKTSDLSKRIAVCLLALLTILAVFCACKTKNPLPGPGESNTVTQPGSSGPEESAAPTADLPQLDLHGAEWRVYAAQNEVEGSFYVDEPESELVSEAIYRTMSTVEDLFKCDIVVEYSGVVADDHAARIKQFVETDDHTYSMVELHDAIGTNTALQGYFANLYDIPYLSLTTPWWHSVEELTINGKEFMIDTDMSIYSLSCSWMIFFNKDIMDDYSLEYPYQTVLDGNWTLEELAKLTKDVYKDLNHDNEMNAGDLYGFHCMESMYGWLDFFDVKTIVRENDGSLAVTDEIEKIQNIVDLMHPFLRGSVGAHTSGVPNYVDIPGFSQGNYMMFHHALVDASNTFRFVDNLNYGVLPSPKLDERQKDYYTSTLTYPFWIPSNLTDTENETAGAVIEALSYYGYLNTIPAYYERALKQKYNPDEESSKMIEIIHDGLRASFSWCYGNFGQVFYFTLYDLFNGGSTDFQAYYDSKISVAQNWVDYLNQQVGLG